MLKFDFKLNLIYTKTDLYDEVRTPLIYYEIVLSLIDMKLQIN